MTHDTLQITSPGDLLAVWLRATTLGTPVRSGADVEPRLDSARRLLARPLHSVRAPFASPGLGMDVRIAGNGVVGAALVHDGSVLHTALFRRRQTPANGGMLRPGERARRLER